MDRFRIHPTLLRLPSPLPLPPPDPPAPPASEKETKEAPKEGKEKKDGKEKFIDKALLKVSILISAISAAALLNFPTQIPNDQTFKHLYKAYALLSFATFSTGLGSVVYASLLHKPDKSSAFMCRRLMWTGLTLMELTMGLGALLKMLF